MRKHTDRSWRKACLIVLAGVAVATLAPAPAEAKFGSRFNLSKSGEIAGDPQVGVDGAGNTVIAWRGLVGTDFRAPARTSSAAGALGLC
jgi:hypothetical protein